MKNIGKWFVYAYCFSALLTLGACDKQNIIHTYYNPQKVTCQLNDSETVTYVPAYDVVTTNNTYNLNFYYKGLTITLTPNRSCFTVPAPDYPVVWVRYNSDTQMNDLVEKPTENPAPDK